MKKNKLYGVLFFTLLYSTSSLGQSACQSAVEKSAMVVDFPAIHVGPSGKSSNPEHFSIYTVGGKQVARIVRNAGGKTYSFDYSLKPNSAREVVVAEAQGQAKRAIEYNLGLFNRRMGTEIPLEIVHTWKQLKFVLKGGKEIKEINVDLLLAQDGSLIFGNYGYEGWPGVYGRSQITEIIGFKSTLVGPAGREPFDNHFYIHKIGEKHTAHTIEYSSTGQTFVAKFSLNPNSARELIVAQTQGLQRQAMENNLGVFRRRLGLEINEMPLNSVHTWKQFKFVSTDGKEINVDLLLAQDGSLIFGNYGYEGWPGVYGRSDVNLSN